MVGFIILCSGVFCLAYFDFLGCEYGVVGNTVGGEYVGDPTGAFEFVGNLLGQAGCSAFGCLPHVDTLGDHVLNSVM